MNESKIILYGQPKFVYNVRKKFDDIDRVRMHNDIWRGIIETALNFEKNPIINIEYGFGKIPIKSFVLTIGNFKIKSRVIYYFEPITDAYALQGGATVVIIEFDGNKDAITKFIKQFVNNLGEIPTQFTNDEKLFKKLGINQNQISESWFRLLENYDYNNITKNQSRKDSTYINNVKQQKSKNNLKIAKRYYCPNCRFLTIQKCNFCGGQVELVEVPHTNFVRIGVPLSMVIFSLIIISFYSTILISGGEIYDGELLSDILIWITSFLSAIAFISICFTEENPLIDEMVLQKKGLLPKL